TVNALPSTSLTVGGSTSICSGNATNITVAASVSGINYQLRNGITSVGTAVAGNGSLINLSSGTLTSTTTFNVLAINATSSCSAQLTGTAVVTVNPLPAIGLTVGGTTSINSGTATNITVTASVVGTSYQLRNDNANQLIGSPVSGNGSTITMTTGNLVVATTFNVYATLGSCSAELSSMAVVSINSVLSTLVTNNNNDGVGSLRYAILNVPEGGTVTFASTSAIDGQTIVLTTGTLTINKNLILDNSNHTLGVGISGSFDNFTIIAGKTLTLATGSKFTSNGIIRNNAGISGLLIASGASLIQNTMDLQATVKRLLNPGWHLFGSPFKQNTGSSLAGLIPGGGSIQMIPYSNGVNWGSTVTSPYYYFIPTTGYAVKPSASVTASLTGNLYYSQIDYSIPLIYNGTAATQSWNLVANPYTSYINWNLLGKTNLNTSLYIWDNALYPLYTPVTNAAYFRTYNSCNNVGVPSGTTPYIAPLQGFFVRAVYTSPRLSFLPSARLHSSSAYYKGASNTEILLRLKTETDKGADELVICKNQDSKLDFEQFDSEKLFADLPLQIYSQSMSGEKLVINSINTTAHAIIPLGINGSAGDKARITAFALESAEQVYLEDRLKGKMISLSENTTYDFEFPSDNITGRFFIRFGDINTSLTNSDIKVFEDHDKISIIAQTGEEIQSVEIIAVTGSCVFKAEVDNGNVFVREVQLPRAIYMVRVKTSISTQNVKINWK
ncbi:MAG: hypothetical protein ACOYOV_13115, partial [Bacteroidales bacterium]